MAYTFLDESFNCVMLFQYSHEGLRELPNRLRLATDDTSQYLDNTGREINALLVTNYAELEEVLGEILDDSGPILKRTLAQVTQAVAIDNLVKTSKSLSENMFCFLPINFSVLPSTQMFAITENW